MATSVLVDGGFCRRWVSEDTATVLAVRGHRVEVVDLPSSAPILRPGRAGELRGDGPAGVDACGTGVVLVGDSGSGMVLAELADHPGVGHSSTWQPCAPGGALCAGVEEDRFLREVYPRFVASSLQLMADASSAPPAAHETTYVICEEDQAVPVAAQEAMSAQADRVERLPSSHDPQLSMPERLAEILDSAARATAGGPSSLAPEPRNSGEQAGLPNTP